jgi:hypothetical protein
MRRVGDYSDEMGPFAISDSDIERILRGQVPHGPGLSRLVAMVAGLRAQRELNLRPEIVSRHVAMAVEAVRAATPAPRVASPAPAASRWRLVPRLGASVAAFALVIGMTGVAVASNAAAPGEPLHGIDVFLEDLGIGDGGNPERISEAQSLSKKGMAVEALAHLTSTLSENSGATDALKTAVERLGANDEGSEQSQQVREGVADMLDWMATTNLEGDAFGQGVAEQARALSGNEQGGPEPEVADKGKGSQPGQGKGQGRAMPPGKPDR